MPAYRISPELPTTLRQPTAPSLGQSPYAIALSFDFCKENPTVKDAFDAAIDALEEDGTIAELEAKWCE